MAKLRCARPIGAFRALARALLLAALAACAATPGREAPLGYVVSTAFSPDGTRIAAATGEGEIALFDARPLRFRTLFTRDAEKAAPSRDYVEAIAAVYRRIPLAFSRDGALLAARTARGNLVVWIVASGAEALRAPAPAALADLAFSPDGRTLYTAGAELVAWSLDEGGRRRALELPTPSAATAAALSPDGLVIAVGLSNGDIAMLEASTGRLLSRTSVHRAPVTGVAFEASGRAFASTAGGYDLRLWQHAAGGELAAGAPAAGAASAARAFENAQGAGALLWLLGTLRGFQIAGAPTLGAPPILGGADDALARAARSAPFHCGSRAAFSADGRYLVSTANLMKAPDAIGTLAPAFLLFVTDLRAGKTTSIRDQGCEVSISPDGTTFATGGPGAPMLWRTDPVQRIRPD